MPIDPWKHVQSDANPLTNPYLKSFDDCFLLKDISCVDASGNVFERYDTLAIQKDIFRNAQCQIDLTSYNGAVHCEQQGLFLPSFALTCNIVAALCQNRNNVKAKKILDMYKDKGTGEGIYFQNTLINYATEDVIHCPLAADFDQTTAVNTARQRKQAHFKKAALQSSLLEHALTDTAHTRYVKQLTGLADPALLVEIGKYFGSPARLWFPWNEQESATCTHSYAAWFSCGSDGLNIYGSGNLSDSDAARGVRKIV